MSWRVVIVTRIPPVLLGFEAVVRDAGHEPVALLTMRSTDGRYGPIEDTTELLRAVPAELDVLVPARRSTIAPLLASVEPDLVVCMGFPWKIPPDALAVPRLGWLNGHPSLLPRHRGPLPVAWAIREGDEETAFTFHRMDAELDTGPILAQRRFPLGEYEAPDAFYPRIGPIGMEALGEALERLGAGEEGTPQEEGGSYETFFSEDDVWLDLSRPAAEIHRLAWAWRYAMAPGRMRGALLELDGTPVRVLATSLTEVEGARRLECGDGPLWVVETEELSEEAATPSSAPAPSTQ
ncbi:MAG TPA: formyltransferase family protein [Gaiellaceae bacterium]